MIMRSLSVFLLFLAVLSTSCRVSYSTVRVKDGFLLKEVEAEDGSTTAFRLYSGSKAPKMHRTHKSFDEVPSFGIKARTIKAGNGFSERYGIDAFEGVLVNYVQPDSAAALAGIRDGDVIRSIGDTQVVSSEQLEYLITAGLVAGESVQVELIRPRESEDAVEVNLSTISLTPQSKRVEVSKTDVLPLDFSETVMNLTGMQIAGLTPELSKQIYGDESSVVLIAYVLPGSPAYFAGLRRGDRILQCDGRPVTHVSDIRRSVRGRASTMKISLDEMEEVSATVAMQESESVEDDAAEAGEMDLSKPMKLVVDGPLGAHSTELKLSDELDEEYEFDIPIIVEYNSDVDSTRFAFLDFIFQFGWNYNSRYVHSATRKPRSSSYFSLFPFGMFEFVRSPKKSETTLLWFITFETKR
ncbi:MAG: hypothetical protein ACI841_001566 [Planctomycetota bacterium]|jgi:hypothetical protein